MKEKISCVYKLTNLLNGKIYIGKANDFYKRMYHHARAKADTYLGNAIRLYGWKNFFSEVLEECKVADLCERETFYILLLKSNDRDVGYNILISGFDRTGIPHSEKTKIKISKGGREKVPRGDEHYTRLLGPNKSSISAMQHANTGKHRSEQVKKAISENNKGKRCKYNEKPINQICPITNNLIKTWDSAQLAANSLAPTKSASGIRAVAHKRPNKIGNIQKTAHGYKWEFV